MPDLRPLFTDQTARRIHPALQMVESPTAPALMLDADTIGLLQDGLGLFDMEIRWLAHLDGANVLRLWRSWTGHQIYEASLDLQNPDLGVLRALKVENHPDRHEALLDAEPGRFERSLVAIVNTLRRFRAGHTPYGPAPGAEPLPPTWP